MKLRAFCIRGIERASQLIRCVACCTLLASPSTTDAQERSGGARVIVRGRISLTAPEHAKIDSLRALKAINLARQATIVRGLPRSLLASTAIRLSLAADAPVSADAVSFPAQRIIALPMAYWLEWHDEKLATVIRHEVAHLALAVFMYDRGLPWWFQEGFAEWATGPLSCEGEARIRLSLVSRGAKGAPHITEVHRDIPPSRLQYDYLASFFEYLDIHRAVSSGRLLAHVRKSGIDAALTRVFENDLETLNAEWRAYLASRYAGGLSTHFKCQKQPEN